MYQIYLILVRLYLQPTLQVHSQKQLLQLTFVEASEVCAGCQLTETTKEVGIITLASLSRLAID